MNISKFLSIKIQKALVAAGVPAHYNAQVRSSTKKIFGDYQVNGIMTIAKQLCIPSLQLAKKINTKLDLTGIARKINIVNPGFINIFLEYHWLAQQLNIMFLSTHLNKNIIKPQTIVVDYSSPNLAKEMHVGHLRSTIIGDALVRILIFLGHHVIRANHVGDWGTQFGMLIAYIEKNQIDKKIKISLPNLETFYIAAKQNFESDSDFAELVRNYVVKLQHGDDRCYKIWHKLVDASITQNQIIYNKLNVTLTRNDVIGESFYKNMLPDIIEDLKNKKIAVKNKGATVVFLEEFKNKKGEPMGVIIQKKDGAYLYITTDIACIKYRYETLKADRIIYYTDSRQHLHLMQAWAIARKAGYIPDYVSLEHHMFGMVLDKNGKPFKTRDGGVIKIKNLLNESLKRTRNFIANKKIELTTYEIEKLAKIISIGALKYADLSKKRTTDYVFNWDNILSFQGNTAPYIQYAYARISSIFKHKNQHDHQLIDSIQIENKQEARLAIHLLQLEETIMAVAYEGMPHILCDYLYNLAVLFSVFYENCPILNADNKTKRQSRMKLALLTARTIKQGLNLLGIETVDKM